MTGAWASCNGRLVPTAEAVVGVDDVDFAYGFGVYETLKVRGRVLFFPEMHEERLFQSAALIGLEHPWQPGEVTGFLRELCAANRCENGNIKVILLGGREGARLWCMCLNPLFPERRDYREGARAIVYPGERVLPQAKTLNMLVSSMAFREARRAGAYDALFLSRDGRLSEGTRTNLFYTDGEAIFTPPAAEVLSGVTRATIMMTIAQANMVCRERTLLESELPGFIGYFLSSTSTKIMPLGRLGSLERGIPDIVRRLMRLYDEFLEAYCAAEEPLFR